MVYQIFPTFLNLNFQRRKDTDINFNQLRKLRISATTLGKDVDLFMSECKQTFLNKDNEYTYLPRLSSNMEDKVELKRFRE